MTVREAIKDAVFALELDMLAAPFESERWEAADKIIAALDTAGFDIVAKADLQSLLKELEGGIRLVREMNDFLGVPPPLDS